MKKYRNLKASSRSALVILGTALIGALTPLVAQAGQKAAPNCNALVSMSNNLYLVTSAGKTLTQFTTDGTSKNFATISPSGEMVAYTTRQTATTFDVVNQYGQAGTFPMNQETNSASGGTADTSSYLMGLRWSSDSTLRLTTFYGKDYAQFQFLRIPDNLAPPATTAAKSTVDENCVLKEAGGLVACIEQSGFVSLGSNANGKGIYSVSRFKSVTPLASFNLHVGASTTPSNAPPYRVTVVGISGNTILLSLDALNPKYPGSAEYVKSGSYMGVTDYKNSDTYGYFATIINAKSGLVRIDIVKSNTPDEPFDRGLAWQPHGQGLLFVQRTNTQTFLDLIQPGRGHVSGHAANGQGPQWHLAAKVPISLPGKVQSMRFLTPDFLLLNTGDFRGPQYSEVPIHIANGQDNGKPALTVGAVSPMPEKISITTNGKTTQASVLDWSCPSHS